VTARYKILPPWTTREQIEVGAHVVVVESATLLDARTDHAYGEGAWRVSVEGPSPKPRTRTFKGETAWSAATRYAEDARYGFLRAAPWG
jgi:hypothetical protein